MSIATSSLLSPTLEELRIQAKILLKSLRSGSRPAAERLRRLPFFAERSADRILSETAEVQLKHAFAVLALEQGYATWNELKAACDLREKSASPTGRAPVAAGDRYYPPGRMGSGLNRWFTSYDEARTSLDAYGGYLFPYRTQFFVCEEAHIEALGLDPADPDWARIGHDWVKPRDPEAHQRLDERLA
ncbi:MAG: hypothetical protein ABI193_06050 [Minicystis sp.]